MKLVFLTPIALLATVQTASAANLINNGGFENPTVSGSCCITSPSVTIPFWTVTAGDVNVVTGSFPTGTGNRAFEGTQYLDLIGEGANGTIRQAVATTAGRYRLNFAYSHNSFANLGAASGVFSVGSLSNVPFAHMSGSASNLDWKQLTTIFTATGATSLSFTNVTGGDNAGMLIDAVSVTAVPEASTWAMMIGGFGAIGTALRRRRRAKLTVVLA